MRIVGALALSIAIVLTAGCGSVVEADDDGGALDEDASGPRDGDAGSPPDDGASPGDDAGGSGSSPRPPSREITGGSARLEGSTYEMDVQIGHPSSQESMSAGDKALEGNAAVKP